MNSSESKPNLGDKISAKPNPLVVSELNRYINSSENKQNVGLVSAEKPSALFVSELNPKDEVLLSKPQDGWKLSTNARFSERWSRFKAGRMSSKQQASRLSTGVLFNESRTSDMSLASAPTDRYGNKNFSISSYFTSEFTLNKLSSSVFLPTEMSIRPASVDNVCFTFRVLTRFFIRLINIVLNVLLIVLSEQEIDGLMRWVFWGLLLFYFLPFPVLLLWRMDCRGSSLVLKLLQLSSFIELWCSYQRNDWTSDLLIIDAIEGLFATIPTAILEFVILIAYVEPYTRTWWICFSAVFFSVSSAASAMQGIDTYVFGSCVDSYGYLVMSSVFYLYCFIDVSLSTFCNALCSLYFSNVVFSIHWGCVLLLFRFISRVLIYIGIFLGRKTIRRGGSSRWCEILVFGFLVAGPVQWLCNIPFIHEIALQGVKQLLAFRFLETFELALMLFCVYEDGRNVLCDYWLYVLVSVAVLQLAKVLLGVLKTYPDKCYVSTQTIDQTAIADEAEDNMSSMEVLGSL